MHRRRFLGLAGAAVAAGCATTRSAPVTVERIPYGEAPRQHIELYRPPGDGPHPVVALVHGGFWSSQHRLDLMDPLRDDLARAGTHAVVNVEYRSLGDDGGGWPGTLEDAAAAIDLLADLRATVDTASVTVVGHSAGGQLAAWLAGRPNLVAAGPGGTPAVVPRRVISLAGILDLVAGADLHLGEDACQELLGGDPIEVPDRYAIASPIALLPYGADVVCVHGHDDRHVPPSQSEAFVTAATAAGTLATLHAGRGDHFDLINPGHELWTGVRDRVLGP